MTKLRTLTKVDWSVAAALVLASVVASGCSNPEKKYCGRLLEKHKANVSDEDEFLDKCTAEIKQDIERCKNADEVAECYGKTTDTDGTECVRICEFTKEAEKNAAKSSKCGDMMDRCMKVCGTDHDCRMDCVEANERCEGSDDD